MYCLLSVDLHVRTATSSSLCESVCRHFYILSIVFRDFCQVLLENGYPLLLVENRDFAEHLEYGEKGGEKGERGERGERGEKRRTGPMGEMLYGDDAMDIAEGAQPEGEPSLAELFSAVLDCVKFVRKEVRRATRYFILQADLHQSL